MKNSKSYSHLPDWRTLLVALDRKLSAPNERSTFDFSDVSPQYSKKVQPILHVNQGQPNLLLVPTPSFTLYRWELKTSRKEGLMVRNDTYEEFVRWRKFLISIVPSNSVHSPRYALRTNQRTQLAVKRADLQEPSTATNEANGDQDRDEQAFVHIIRSGLEPTGQTSQLWDD
jgi:hypothetical protein